MTTIIIVLGNTDRRYLSNHEYFQKRAHFGYFPISEDALANIPKDIYDSLVQINAPLLVFLYVAGAA